MSYQVSCPDCGQILEGQMPIISNGSENQFECTNCGRILFTMYGVNHPFTEYRKKVENSDSKQEKQVENTE